MLAKEDIFEEVMTMKPAQKAELIDKLILSLDIPNQEVEELWKEEVENRVEAYENGDIETVSIKEVFKKYEV
ncbi:addiction module protein [Sulfurospirillum sp. 1307]|jgi:Glu-tRNA(Gln) amidotransferase subunit E-like FAD-binding protein